MPKQSSLETKKGVAKFATPVKGVDVYGISESDRRRCPAEFVGRDLPRPLFLKAKPFGMNYARE